MDVEVKIELTAVLMEVFLAINLQLWVKFESRSDFGTQKVKRQRSSSRDSLSEWIDECGEEFSLRRVMTFTSLQFILCSFDFLQWKSAA